MKTIQPISLWKDGAIEVASIIDMYISYDDLKSQCAFQYVLYNDTFSNLANGKIDMLGQDYIDWDNSNDSAYTYAASVLNLQITGNYIPPTPASDVGTEDI